MTACANVASNETAVVDGTSAPDNTPLPCMTWDLTLQPEQLERAFWTESTEQFRQQDYLVRGRL